jgi:plasmid replication initiation protein
MAMALLPTDLSSLTVSFSFTDFCKALGYGDGGEQYRMFDKAVDECMESVIRIDNGNVIRGKKSWEKFTWFDHAKFNAETGVCTMSFNPRLAAVLQELKRVYSRINLADVGRLQSKYGIRYLEMAESYASLKGKDGNAETGVCTMSFNSRLAAVLQELKRVYSRINLADVGRLQSKYGIRYLEMAESYASLKGKDGNAEMEWYFERSILDLRFMLGVDDTTYKETKRFRQFAVENPVKELNAAGIGVEIKTESIKKGRTLASIRFGCKRTPKTPSKKPRGRKKKTETSSDAGQPGLPFTEDEWTRENKELQHLKERYPEEFAERFKAAMESCPAFMVKTNLGAAFAENRALMELREKYGIVK